MNDFYTKLKELMPLKYKKEDGDFRNILYNTLDRYVFLLQEHKDKFCCNIDDVINYANTCKNEIMQCVNYYYEGRYSTAYECIERILGKDPFKTGYSNINKGEIFYRARIFDTTRKKTYNEMFHIPLDKRGIVKTQRYSAPGYPCLYLGSHINACWVELGEPRFDDMMVSRFVVTQSFPVLDLRMPMEKDLTEDKLKKLPLIISASVCVLDREAYFKPEYIITQLITEYIITRNRELRDRKKRTNFNLDLGVYYTSTHINNDLDFPEYTFDNLALPVVEVNSETNYCQLLASCFEWTDPTSYAYEDIKERFGASLIDVDADSKLSPKEINYKHSKMGELEERISDKYVTKKLDYLVIEDAEINLSSEGNAIQLGVRSSGPFTIE